MGGRTYQSPQSVMSMTSCWAVKNCVRLHCEFTGYDAEGVPKSEISIDDVEVA